MNNYLPNEYRTRDIGEAGALLSFGFEIIRVDRDGSIAWFIFFGSSDLETCSHQYWYGELLVNAKSFHDALKTLKNRIFRG